MLFSWEDMVVWIGMTLFEMWINVMSLVVFLALLTLQLDGIIAQSWWVILSPLFAADALNAYFVIIVMIRMHLGGMCPVMRSALSLTSLALLFAFKMMLCKKLSGQDSLDFSEVVSPIFVLLQYVAIRTRQLCRSSVTIER